MITDNPPLDTSRQEWNFDLIFADGLTPQQVDQQFMSANERFSDKWRDRTDYLSDPKVLRVALGDYEKLLAGNWINIEYGWGSNLSYYYWLRGQLNSNDPEVIAGQQSGMELAVKAEELVRFFELALSTIATEDQANFLNDPELSEYHYFLTRIFTQAKHRLSQREENIIAMKYVTSHKKWVELTRRALTTQKREVLLPDGTCGLRNFNELFGLIANSNESVREDAAVGYNSILARVLDVAEAEINAIVANKKVDDELRDFSRPDAALLLKDSIEPSVIDVMLDSVERKYDISHRYYQLKAQFLGVERLTYTERFLQLGSLSRHYDWETACHIVDNVYRKLDPHFSELFRTYLRNGQIDVLPRLGKEPNSFTSRFHKLAPSYILINYTGTLNDVITLAHEFGHGLTNEYMRQNQLSLNFNNYKGTAEVSSQFFEEFTYEHILNDADEDMRLAVNMSRLDKAVNFIHRQVACYRFEQKLHSVIRENGYLSSAEIGRLFQGEMSAYMGPAVIQSAGSENWWVQWQHIRKMFINYSYASGNLIAKAMYRSTKEDIGFLDNVKAFMSTGISVSQRDIFTRMGIDIADSAFWTGSLEQIENLLDECEKLAIKRKIADVIPRS